MSSPKPIIIPIPERACVVALGPYREGASLRPESRAAIESAPKSPLGITFRDVSCTPDVARDMLDARARQVARHDCHALLPYG